MMGLRLQCMSMGKIKSNYRFYETCYSHSVPNVLILHPLLGVFRGCRIFFNLPTSFPTTVIQWKKNLFKQTLTITYFIPIQFCVTCCKKTTNKSNLIKVMWFVWSCLNQLIYATIRGCNYINLTESFSFSTPVYFFYNSLFIQSGSFLIEIRIKKQYLINVVYFKLRFFNIQLWS